MKLTPYQIKGRIKNIINSIRLLLNKGEKSEEDI